MGGLPGGAEVPPPLCVGGGYLGIDKTLFDDIWAKCSDSIPNNDVALVDMLVYNPLYQRVLRMKVRHPLNLVPYIKKNAEDEVQRRFGWQPM
jgi:hypothetical protein